MNDELAAPETPPAPGDHTTPPGEPAAPRRRLRLLVPVLATVVVLGAVGGGVAHTANYVDTADKKAPTTYWRKSDKTRKSADGAPGASHTGVGKLLLPVGDNYRPGPDIDEFGNDTELTGKQALALLKQGARGLPGKMRREYVKAVEKQKIQGQAMRSYAGKSSDLVVEIQLTQMSEKAAKDAERFQKALVDVWDSLPPGPKIKGYKNAVCAFAPKDTWEKQDVLHCTAAKGGVLVTLTAYGPRKIDRKAVATMLKAQLDRVTDGEKA
ncbi:hypothetical protein AB0M28_19220 [Streptomyces sp. NPDC051940]|uniref:hypothetical protein n=1 Tax=Streptomyces sp. NPDC051940 TaxID=3155675 RepID=UPI00342E12F9